MGEFLDFIIACILIFYILRLVLRYVLPMLFERAVNRAQQHFQQNDQQQYRTDPNQQQHYTRTNTTANEKVKVDYVPPQKKKKGSVPDSAGDFIDFEEVK